MNDSLSNPSADELKKAETLSAAVQRARGLAETPRPADPSEKLRWLRHQAWIKCAVPSLLGSMPASLVCKSWSDAADEFLTTAFEQCFGKNIALFALGKLGSQELNLSSDVDIVLVSLDDDAASIPALRKFQKLLAENGPSGFVLRTDFDLRPGGRLGPLIPTVDQFVDYYGNYGETWERMAFVRLRAITGDASVIASVEKFVARFSYRKHLDYGLLEDLKNMRGKIHNEHWKNSEGGWIDLKLGIGGIRDVELFFHALQVIHGGKDTSLRTASTTKAAKVLADKKLLPAVEAQFLIDHYWCLREIENYAQALGDEQTHRIHPDHQHPDFIRKDLADVAAKMQKCSRLVSDLLGHPPPIPTTQELKAAAEGLTHEDLFEEILQIPLLSRNKDKDEGTRRALLQKFMLVVREQKADAHLALSQLKEFLKSTRAKASFFDLLLREDKLLRELAWLFGHSAYLGRLLCYRPELLDAFIFRAQDLNDSDLEPLLEQLVEKRLLAEIIEGSRFLRDGDMTATSRALTENADGILNSLMSALRKEYPSNLEVLALGKWGGREMGFRSDLDFIFVSANEATDADHKFARRLISRLTEPHRGGNIFPVDMRLRPSGKAGPLVIPASELKLYLENEAAVWERQAYTRARWIAKPLFEITPCLFQKNLGREDLQELNRIRRELLPKDSGLDLKYSEGGLVDLELYAQTRILLEKKPLGSTPQILESLGNEALIKVYVRLRQIEQTAQLVSAQSVHKLDENSELLQPLAAALNMSSPQALRAQVSELLVLSTAELGRLDPRRTSG